MTRRFGWLFLPIVLLVAGLVGAADDPPPGPADEPPVLLKKKKPGDKPKAPPAPEKEPPKDAPKAKIDDEPDEPEVPVEDEQEVLNRIARNLKTAEDRLANREVGEGTRQVQRDILKDLDSLIAQLQQPPQGGENGNESNNQSKQSGMQGQKQQGGQGGQGGQRASGGMRLGRNQQQLSRKGGQNQGQGQGNQPQQGMAQNGSGTNGGGGRSSEEVNRLTELRKDDIWGHLPESMRREMDVYAREQFMAKYSEMIKQYYSTVAKESREK